MAETLRLAGNDLLAADASGESLDHLLVELHVHDPETIAALRSYPEGGRRDQFALSALRIGVLALRQAQGQLDAQQVQRECERMLTGLQKRLDEHSTKVNDRLATALREYFDPETGRFQQRVKALVEKDGELERTLRKLVGTEDSELCRTLVSHVGATSPLMKMLSPKESEGILSALNESVEARLTAQRDAVLRQFSLDNKDGALARLVGELNSHQGKFTEIMQGKIDSVVKEFSLDKEDSALNRLVKNVTAAQQTITSEFSLDNDTSALSRLKRVLESHAEQNQKFQEEVKTTLATLAAKREQVDRTTLHGVEFEDAVQQFLEHVSQQAGDVAEAVGMKTGLKKHCKTGDCVVILGPDCAAPGARIVLEAKEDTSYDVSKARAELEEARINRDAAVGVFVFSKKAAPATLEPVTRYGHDVLVVWDPTDPASDVFLKVGLTLAKALCVRAAREREHQAVDLSAIDVCLIEIAKRTNSLDEIVTWTGNIKRDAAKIDLQVEKARDAVVRQIGILEEKLADLKQSLDAPAS